MAEAIDALVSIGLFYMFDSSFAIDRQSFSGWRYAYRSSGVGGSKMAMVALARRGNGGSFKSGACMHV